jgi:hypothetical protein
VGKLVAKVEGPGNQVLFILLAPTGPLTFSKTFAGQLDMSAEKSMMEI